MFASTLRLRQLINGDISNESPRRIIVNIDVVAESDIETQKKFLSTTTSRKILNLNRTALSAIWLRADRFGLSVELAAFASDNWTQDDLDNLMGKLERRGTNPFNYAELYEDIEEFIEDIPYRNNLQGVVDIRSRVARYGSYGIEIENL